MAINLYKREFALVPQKELTAWKKIPTAVIGDSLNRQNVMRSNITPIFSCCFSGQASTVSTLAGDNGSIHAAMRIINAGEVLVIDGGGYTERAIWGGILNTIAKKKKVAGVVIDGSIRDINELREMDIPIFAIGGTPAGPHKGWGGEIDSNISCGGVSVSPGDLIVGDNDGVVVIPLAQKDTVLELSKKKLEQEKKILDKIAQNCNLDDVITYPSVNVV